MFEKLYGKTQAEQKEFLEGRLIVSIVVIAGSIIASFFMEEALALIAVVCYFWGWWAIKSWFGLAGFATWIWGHHNIVMGCILLLFFLILGYLLGLFSLLAGIICYAMLQLKK